MQWAIDYDKHYDNDADPLVHGMTQGAALTGFDAEFDTGFTYDALGRLVAADVNDGLAHTVAFTNDENGQVLRRDESVPANAAWQQVGSPHEVWYLFGGRQMGYAGNNGGWEMSTSRSIAEERAAAPDLAGTFRGGQVSSDPVHAFTGSYSPVNAYRQGSGASSYTVRGGESLGQVAQALWGDAGLWYKLAEANGLSGNTSLVAGQTLRVPAGVMRNSYNASTFTPYDPAAAIGDLSPTAPTPHHGRNCGVVGVILMAVVAVAVAAWLGPQMIGTFQGLFAGAGATAAAGSAAAIGGGIVGGAVTGAVASAASQAVGLVGGIQSSFSWKSLGLSALGGAVGGGLTGLSQGANAAGGGGIGKFLASGAIEANAARGVFGSALTQGIGKLIGLQDSFSWAGVAAAGVAGGLGDWTAGKLGLGRGSFGYGVASATAGGIANAATRSALNGESFGTNLEAAIPDIIGQAIGSVVGNGIGVALSGRDSFADRVAAEIKRTEASIVALAASRSDPAVQQPGMKAAENPSAAIAPSTGAKVEVVVGSAGANADLASGLPDAGQFFAEAPSARGWGEYWDRYYKYTEFRLGKDLAGEQYDWTSVEAAFAADYNQLMKADLLVATLSLDVPGLQLPTRTASAGGNSGGGIISYITESLGRTFLGRAADFFVPGSGSVVQVTVPAPIARASGQALFDTATGGITSVYAFSRLNNPFNFRARAEFVNNVYRTGAALIADPAAPFRAIEAEANRVNNLHGMAKAEAITYYGTRAFAEAALFLAGCEIADAGRAGQVARYGKTVDNGGGRFVTEAQVVAGIERNANIAVELTRRQAARGLVTSTDQAFGSRAHLLFERLNTRLGRELRINGSDFRLDAELFRDAFGTVNRGAVGSIGADAFLTSQIDPFYARVFDLKTYGTARTPISTTRQTLFQARFGARAEELYRAR